MTIFKKILNKILTISLIVAFSSGCSLSFAENNAVKLGVIDMQNVIVNSSAYIDITKQIEEKNRANISISEKEQEKLKKRSQEIEAQKNVLSEEAFNKKREELSKADQELKKKFYVERNQLETGYSSSLNKLGEKAMAIVKEIGKKEGFDMLLDKGVALYVKEDARLDLTEMVAKELNKEMPAMKVDFANSPAKSAGSGQNEASKNKKEEKATSKK